LKKPVFLSTLAKSWILYDVGNSAFVLVMITTVMPIFFKDIASAGVSQAISTANWGFANAAAALLLAVMAPVLGTFADYSGRKIKFFAAFLGIGLLFTLLLTRVDRGEWLLCLVLFVLARVGWAGANIFYDAFIVDVSPENRMDKISAYGYAAGYIGSVVPFLAIIALLIFGSRHAPGTLPEFESRLSFVIVAAWWLFFSLPMLKNVRQRYFLPSSRTPVADGFRRLWATFFEIRRHRRIFLFLLAYFFYIDGVDTVISMAAAYGRELGFSIPLLIGVILFIQVIAFPFALLYGHLAQRFSAKSMLMTGILVYGGIVLVAFWLPSVSDDRLKVWIFWGIAFLVGTSMGGIQALSRSFFANLIPPAHSSEFFGFYNVFGKFAAITGPFLMGVIGRMTGHSRWGILSILVLLLIGALILAQVRNRSEALQIA
jgi:MFS transporter, UMF1 family